MMMSVMAALVISASIKIVGALLVSALLTIPAACSLAAARSFRQSIFTVVIVAEIAVVAGLMIAGVWNLAPGATIVLLLIAILLLLLVGRVRFRV
ncbi:High-affinity zinc uptake system membrane protein ZnuB [compost metagenome]